MAEPSPGAKQSPAETVTRGGLDLDPHSSPKQCGAPQPTPHWSDTHSDTWRD